MSIYIIKYATRILAILLQAIETLKSFEKKDSKVACTAATNLSFLYFLVSLGNWNFKTILGKSDNYRHATQVNPGDPLADKDPLKAENPKIPATL